MPPLKIIRGSEQITLTSDIDASITDPQLLMALSALQIFLTQIAAVTSIDITRLSPDVFSYVLEVDNGVRVYAQTWFFDDPVTAVSFSPTTTGKWRIAELLANIELREVFRALTDYYHVTKLECKW